jgi:tetratricopeptide (TPR) repeat protein
MKKNEAAEAEFKKILEVNPDSAATLNYLGYMLADRNVRLQEALQMITKALDKDPDNAAYLDSLGWVYFRLGRLNEAEENLRRAIERGPRDATVHDHLGDVLLKESKVKEAIVQWQASLKEWEASSPSDLDTAEVAKVKNKLEGAKVRLAKEGSNPNKKQM